MSARLWLEAFHRHLNSELGAFLGPLPSPVRQHRQHGEQQAPRLRLSRVALPSPPARHRSRMGRYSGPGAGSLEGYGGFVDCVGGDTPVSTPPAAATGTSGGISVDLGHGVDHGVDLGVDLGVQSGGGVSSISGGVSISEAEEEWRVLRSHAAANLDRALHRVQPG